jgi:hypothetical protein
MASAPVGRLIRFCFLLSRFAGSDLRGFNDGGAGAAGLAILTLIPGANWRGENTTGRNMRPP